MKRVIVREADGHYYIYYVCVHDDTHHTDPSPQTGDSTGTVTWICITAVSLLGVIFCIFAYKKRRREQED